MGGGVPPIDRWVAPRSRAGVRARVTVRRGSAAVWLVDDGGGDRGGVGAQVAERVVQDRECACHRRDEVLPDRAAHRAEERPPGRRVRAPCARSGGRVAIQPRALRESDGVASHVMRIALCSVELCSPTIAEPVERRSSVRESGMPRGDAASSRRLSGPPSRSQRPRTASTAHVVLGAHEGGGDAPWQPRLEQHIECQL